MNDTSNKKGLNIPLSVPNLKGNEWAYVKECLDTEWVSSVGPYVDRFEADICRRFGGRYAVACVNGSAALHIALEIAGVTEKDEVIVPTVTFIASVNAVSYVGAEPVFMDCDSFFNIHPEKTAEFIRNETVFRGGVTINKSSGKRIAALLPVHVFGNAVDLEELVGLCEERNIPIIEDAAESLGTFYRQGQLSGKSAGTVGQIGCLSFNGNKIITTGGGGMIVTDDEKIAEKARYLTTQAKDDPVRYIHHQIGYNYRLTNIQAALGVAQLERLSDHLIAKKSNYDFYRKEIADIPGLTLAGTPDYADNNHWMYALLIDKKTYGRDRENLMSYLTDNGIQSRPLWMLNHLQKPYAGCRAYRIEQALNLYDRTLNIPCSVNLTEEDREHVVKMLKKGRVAKS
ncbi:MAG: LegC family aminotransferase [Candidatus Aminicenantes bacterium]|nr:LegC family aminotransferase [Candidatus Aminicenantes bacterium]